jgi:hypothetical protein
MGDKGLLIVGLASAALALACCIGSIYLDQWIAKREVRKAREGYEARRRIARGEG